VHCVVSENIAPASNGPFSAAGVSYFKERDGKEEDGKNEGGSISPYLMKI
jgi:hypothetical protein